MEYVRGGPVSLKTHSSFNEKWLQTIIAEDPKVLGLGDLELKGVEKIQPNAGRLDLLMQDSEGSQRFEIEIQPGLEASLVSSSSVQPGLARARAAKSSGVT